MVIKRPNLIVQHVPLRGCQARIQGGQSPQHDDLVAKGRARVLGGVRVAVHVVVLPAAAAPVARIAAEQGHFGVEPPDQDLLARQTLLGDDLEEGDGVPVVALEHLPDDAEQVPHALRFAAAQRPQEGRPFRRGRGRDGT